MKLRSLILFIMLGLAAMLSAQATNLLISEYVEGTSYQKAIEIFNGTGAAVDLSTVSLKKQTNGTGAFGNELVLSGNLANNDVFVIVNSSSGGTNLAGEPYVDLATTSQAVNFNGNDAVALFRNGVMIDVVGIVDDPTVWGQDMTLVRNSNIASPTTNFSWDEWTQYPVNTFTYLGSHTFTGGSTDPVIIVSTPNTAVTWYLEQTYSIGWSSANITGNVKIELINVDVPTTLAASVENTGSWNWEIPATQAVGNQFKIKISTLDDSVSDMSDEFFTIEELPVTNYSTIAELRTANPDGTTIYRVTGEAVLTYQQTYRYQKYFQDSTGAIAVDDPNHIITTQYEIGDGVTNIIGTLSTYHNLLQFTPFANFPAASSSGNDVISPAVSISDLNSSFDDYESELVWLNNVTFTDTSAPFATGINYTLTDGTDQIVFRTSFFEADYIGQNIPTGPLNMRVICIQYDDVNEVCARYLADIVPVANSDEVIEPVSVTLLNNYPNPFVGETSITFSIKNPQPVRIEIYNIKGQLVRTLNTQATKTGINKVTWDGRNGRGVRVSDGVYLYKIKDGKYTGSRKMILIK